jgi:hypothetical protein
LALTTKVCWESSANGRVPMAAIVSPPMMLIAPKLKTAVLPSGETTPEKLIPLPLGPVNVGVVPLVLIT